MRNWSEKVWESVRPLLVEIMEHPFLAELADGTLPKDKFRYYISQDNKYIDVYTRVLAHIASRLPDMDDVDTFLQFAKDGVATERILHAQYNPDSDIQKSNAYEFYTAYLKSQAQEDIAVEVAAILPCFWVYLAVGKYLLSIARLEGNPYRAWLETYSDPAFDESTAKAIAICDKLAAATTDAVREKMSEAFVKATKLEWLFWNSAYNYNEK